MRHDCRPPSHVSDEDFDESSSSLPSTTKTQQIPISYLHYSRSRAEVRESINTVVNDSTQPLFWPQVLNLEESILERLREISEWSIERPAQQPETPLGSEMAQKVLLLQLRQSLLLLHRAAGQRATLPSQQTYARTTCIGVATSIIDFYEKMRSEVRAALLALRNDVFQCALSICYDISWPDPWRSKCLSNLLWHAS